MRLFVFLLAGFPIFGSVASVGSTGLDRRDESSVVKIESLKPCVPERVISNSLRQFMRGSEPQVDQAQALLLSKSRQSAKCREEIISALKNAMDKHEIDFDRDPAIYYLWLYGAELLGDLKAVEALDLLISHMGLSSRVFSTSMSHRPALRGVIKMGPIAIPKLTDVLRNNPDPKMRHSAVYCIATIGGPLAVRSLQEVSLSESDKCVRSFIRVSLDSFDDKGNIKNRMEWFSGASCN